MSEKSAPFRRSPAGTASQHARESWLSTGTGDRPARKEHTSATASKFAATRLSTIGQNTGFAGRVTLSALGQGRSEASPACSRHPASIPAPPIAEHRGGPDLVQQVRFAPRRAARLVPFPQQRQRIRFAQSEAVKQHPAT